MKIYKTHRAAVKNGATESVFVDGKQMWAYSGIRPENADERRFAPVIGGTAASGRDSVISFGKYDGLYALRVDGVAGGRFVGLYTRKEDGEGAFKRLVDKYESDGRWVPSAN